MNTNFSPINPNIYGTALPAKEWPQSRGVPRILHLHKGPKEWGDRADLSKIIIEELPHGAVAVDVGTGSGKVPQHFGSIRPDLNWALVSATALDPFIQKQMMERGSSLYHCFVPEDLKLLNDHYGRCSLILDTYGAVTYDNNPDRVLLLFALLLAPGGTASMMVSTTKEEIPTHVFTTDETLQQIADFLKEKMGVTLEWSAKKIESQAKPGTYCTDFLFRMTASHAPKESTNDPLELFSKLSADLRKIIGNPHVVDSPWYSVSGFEIVAKQYFK